MKKIKEHFQNEQRVLSSSLSETSIITDSIISNQKFRMQKKNKTESGREKANQLYRMFLYKEHLLKFSSLFYRYFLIFTLIFEMMVVSKI